MLRAIALSLALLFGIGTIIPLATNYAEAGQKYKKHKKKRSWKGVKKYSKRWWQLYRRQERTQKSSRAQVAAFAPSASNSSCQCAKIIRKILQYSQN